MSRTAHNSRPEIQARKAMHARDPEYQRRKQMWRESRGLKREKVTHWNQMWALAGYPDGFPDFDEFWRSHPRALEWVEARKRDQAVQREINKKHAASVAAGMPVSTSTV